MAREIAAVERMDEASAVAKIDDVLAKTARHAKLAAEADDAHPRGLDPHWIQVLNR